MLPPPAPTVWMSSIGRRTGRPATVRSVERPATPPRISDTSQLVPPMSNADRVAGAARDHGRHTARRA